MAQKNDTPVLLLALLITVALIAGGLWLFGSRISSLLPNSGTSSQAGGETNSGSTGSSNSSTQAPSLQDRLSLGTRILTPGAAPAEKQDAVKAIAAKQYSQAVTELEAYLKTNRNDPEALIDLNNARIGDQRAYAIAVAVPIATAADRASEILRGVAQAQNEINQSGGINGVPLKVMIASDDDNPDVAKQVAEALVQDPSILGVIGHFGSSTTLAAGTVYQQGKLVMISPTSTSVQISNLGNPSEGDYIFRTVPSDRFTATALVRYLLNTLKLQNAAVYYTANSDYSKSLKDEFATALTTEGGQVTAEFDLANSAFNARDALAQATKQGAQALVLLTNTATLDQALQIVAANNQKLPLLGGDSVYGSKTLQVGGQAAVNLIVAVPWIALSNPQSDFNQASRALWGGSVNWRTATAYDAAKVLVAGLQRDPTRQGIQKTLSAPGFSVAGATGAVRFLPSGDRNQAMQLVKVEPGSRSGYGYDFVPAEQ